MFKEVTDRLDKTNELLAKIEQHLKSLTLPPDMVHWASVKTKNFPKVKKIQMLKKWKLETITKIKRLKNLKFDLLIRKLLV